MLCSMFTKYQFCGINRTQTEVILHKNTWACWAFLPSWLWVNAVIHSRSCPPGQNFTLIQQQTPNRLISRINQTTKRPMNSPPLSFSVRYLAIFRAGTAVVSAARPGAMVIIIVLSRWCVNSHRALPAPAIFLCAFPPLHADTCWYCPENLRPVTDDMNHSFVYSGVRFTSLSLTKMTNAPFTDDIWDYRTLMTRPKWQCSLGINSRR